MTLPKVGPNIITVSLLLKSTGVGQGATVIGRSFRCSDIAGNKSVLTVIYSCYPVTLLSLVPTLALGILDHFLVERKQHTRRTVYRMICLILNLAPGCV